MFNNENTSSIGQLAHSIYATASGLRGIRDPELRIALISALQTLSEALYNLCDEKLEELFDNIPVRENSTTPPLACQGGDS